MRSPLEDHLKVHHSPVHSRNHETSKKNLSEPNTLAYFALTNESFILAKFVQQNHGRQQHATVSTVLSLATLGSATQIGYLCRITQGGQGK